MEFTVDMKNKDGNKMMYLISVGVKKDCPDYDIIWKELLRRMNAVSIPIVRVDWDLYDEEGKPHNFGDCLFYAQTFETGFGFVHSLFKNHTIRSNLEFCNFFNGGSCKNNFRKYYAENPLATAKRLFLEEHSENEW